MVLTRFKHVVIQFTSPIVDKIHNSGISANYISLIGFFIVILGSLFFYIDTYILASIFVGIGGILDVIDGEIARRNQVSKKGDFLDHSLDRFSDVLIILGITGGIESWIIGTLAISGTLLTSYMGTQSQAVGKNRVYKGILGRADRITLIVIGGIIHPFISEISILEITLIIIAVLGNITALQRFKSTWSALKKKEK